MSLAILAQPAPSAEVAAFLRRPATLLIGGEWVPSASKVRVPVIDPATGAEVAVVADANAADVDKAVAAARAAFERGPWSMVLPAELISISKDNNSSHRNPLSKTAWMTTSLALVAESSGRIQC
jgi:phenylacetaldehyde dehydrogenase